MSGGQWLLVGVSGTLDLLILASFIIKARDGRVRLWDSLWLAMCVTGTLLMVLV
jgi:hypothetical protein